MQLNWKVLQSIGDVEPEQWDALVGHNNPFVEHAFLYALESSGSVGEGTGWTPVHLTIWEGEQLIGAAPTYSKEHSYGEYIFDWSWADLSHQMGFSYYPKLVVAVPFTPATGPRLLFHPQANQKKVWDALAEGLKELMSLTEASSLHVLFCLDEEASFLENRGLVRRSTHQFHWQNNHYQDFEQFLGSLRSSARKQIRKERKLVCQSGLEIEMVRGDKVSPKAWKSLFLLYKSTSERKWGQTYLTQSFFENALTTIAHRTLLGLARKNGKIVAGTLSFTKGKHIYGRYWGAFEPIDGLHFELCYYRLITYAIENQYSLLEAGAQGTHKIKRGFLPTITHSAHIFTQRQIHGAFEAISKREQKQMMETIEEARMMGPFKQKSMPSHQPLAGVER